MANYRVEIREKSTWQPPVIDKDLGQAPGAPSEGDRYIVRDSYDILNEDCADITDWDDLDNINAVSSQVTFDSKSCFRFLSNTAAANNYAARSISAPDITMADNYVIEFKVFCDLIGTYPLSDHLSLIIDNGTMSLRINLCSDGLFVFDGASYNEVGTNLVVQDTWQTWKFIVTGSNASIAKCDVYLNDVLQASGVDCSLASPSTYCSLYLYGTTITNNVVYFDYIKIGEWSKQWAENIGKVAQYVSASWSYYTPQEGWKVFVDDEKKWYNHINSAWSVEDLHTQNTDTALGAQSEDLDMNTHKITGVVDPVADQDAATKKYVEDKTKFTIGITIDNQNSAISTGYKGFVRVPWACTITKVSLLAGISGSIVVDLWKCSYANYDAGSTHPVDGDSITSATPPTITTATKSEDSTLTAWTTSIAAGDIMSFNVDSITDITKATLIMEVTKT